MALTRGGYITLSMRYRATLEELSMRCEAHELAALIIDKLASDVEAMRAELSLYENAELVEFKSNIQMVDLETVWPGRLN